MLNDGEITCDPDLDPEALTPMVGGRRRIILGSGFVTRYISSDGNGGYKYVGTEEDQRAGKLKNAGILVHELTHVFQNAGTSVFGNGEREAYGREAKFYKDWRRKNGGRLPNSSVQDLIDEANELGRGTFWPF